MQDQRLHATDQNLNLNEMSTDTRCQLIQDQELLAANQNLYL